MTDTAAPRRAPRSGLGRGLNALLGDIARDDTIPTPGSEAGSGVRMIPISSIAPHPDQPRRYFDEAALDELAASIAERGIIQPIVVRPHGHDYQIVAGERRWRAAQRARLHEVPVVVRDYTDTETLQIALVENIQRQDLNAIEEAEAYHRLIKGFGHTQDALAKIIHKSRSHVTNLLRLLDLPEGVRARLVDGSLSMGHARALIGAPDPDSLARDVVAKGLSVRQTERLASAAKPTRKRAGSSTGKNGPDADIVSLERHLADLLGLKVRIAHTAPGGAITLDYSTLDQLDMICQRLSGENI